MRPSPQRGLRAPEILAIEVRVLLEQLAVLHQQRPAWAGGEAILSE